MSDADIVQDIELEQGLLAHLLSNPALIDDIDPVLSPEDFSDPNHGRIFQVMKSFEGPFTPLTLKKFISTEEIAGLRPVEYLDALEQYGVQPHRDTAVPIIVSQLIDLSRRRSIIRLCDAIKSQAGSPGAPSYNTLIESVEDQIYKSPTTGESFIVKTAADGGDEAIAQAKFIMESGDTYGVRARLKAWNGLVGSMLPGDLIVIGGATSAGKTALAQQIGYEVADQDKTVLCFSLEMTLPQWTTRYLSQQTGIETERIETGDMTNGEWEALQRANNDLLRHLKMVVTDRPCLTVSQMRSFAKRVRRRYNGIDLVIIDHLQFIQPPPRLEGPAAIAAITRELKAMAKDLEVPIILVSHLNRDVSHRDNKRPLLSDLFGSSAIEKDADVVAFVHREHYWLTRQGPKMPEDETDWVRADELKELWKKALRHIEGDADIILAKRRRGRGDGSITVDFDMKNTKFKDRVYYKQKLFEEEPHPLQHKEVANDDTDTIF